MVISPILVTCWLPNLTAFSLQPKHLYRLNDRRAVCIVDGIDWKAIQMVREPSTMNSEIRANMRGGLGAVTIQHLFRPEEFGGKVRLCARLTLPPGASIGPHAHAGEDEVYLIARGSGLLDEDGREIRVNPGDAVLTGKGASHAIRNDGSEPLEIVAFIVKY